ncbi:MAG: acyl-CoA dehydrogenase family protein [Acidimicrobiales bacterium]
MSQHVQDIDRDQLDQYRLRVRRDLAEVVAPRVEEAEKARAFPTDVLVELAKRGHIRERWAADPTRGLLYGTTFAYELGRLLCGGFGAAWIVQAELAPSVLQAEDGDVDLYEAAIDGRTIFCFAVSEPVGGSNLGGLRLQARRAGDSWVLNGAKKWISLARGADYALVLARTRGGHHLTFFAVPQGVGGYRVVKDLDKLGTHSIETCELDLSDVRVPDSRRLGGVGLGLPLFGRAITAERLATVALLVGTLETTIELAATYLTTRNGPNGPLSDLQALRHRVADLVATQLALRSALSCTAAEVAAGRAGAREVAALKLVAAHQVEQSISEALQLFGGAGYTTDWPVERALRDCRMARIAGGTDEIMRELVASTPLPRGRFDAWLTDRTLAVVDPGGIP